MSEQADRLQRRLAAIPARVKQAVQPALQRSGEEVADLMEQLAPEDTGALKQSITVTPPYSQPGGATTVPENAVAITVGNDEVRYPHLVEFGTSEAPAQPFFWPAVRLARKRVTNRIKRAIRKAIHKDAAA